MSSTVDRPGDVAEGEIITIPLAIATLAKIAPVTPEQSAPIIPLTLSEVINFSALAEATAESMHVESARTAVTVEPLKSSPDAETSAIAASAP